MPKQKVDSTINKYAQSLYLHNYAQVFTIDIDMVLKCVWFYATEKPYSAEAYKKAGICF